MSATSNPTDSITILRSDKPMAKEVVVGADGLPVVGKVKMGFLFDVTERSVAGIHALHDLLQDLQHDQYAAAIRGPVDREQADRGRPSYFP